MDLDRFEERAAIMEFDGGMSRFEAETKAAALQGYQRWEVMNAIRNRDFEKARHQHQGPVGNTAHHMPQVQPSSKEETRSVLERNVPAGWGSVELLALRGAGR